MSRYEDDRGSAGTCGELLLQFKAAHSGQTQIENQTIRPEFVTRTKELFCRRENLWLKASGHDEPAYCPAHRFFVVHDGYHPAFLHIVRSRIRIARAHGFGIGLWSYGDTAKGRIQLSGKSASAGPA
jgi:hypothetical protein